METPNHITDETFDKDNYTISWIDIENTDTDFENHLNEIENFFREDFENDVYEEDDFRLNL